MSNLLFRVKEGWKMFSGHYRIERIDGKVLMKYTEILVRRRRRIKPKRVEKLVRAIRDFNEIVEEVNY